MSKIKVGWLQQNMVNNFGGAEFSAQALVSGAPKWAEVIYCPPNMRPPEEMDIFVLQNSTVYTRRWIEELAQKPVIKHVRDPWYAGDVVLKRWLLENAQRLIFSSPIHLESLGYETDVKTEIIPVPINLHPFKAAALPEDEREGAIFVGRLDMFKGITAVIDWGIRTGETLALVGDHRYAQNLNYGPLPDNIRVLGKVSYDKMPELLGAAKTYVAMPEWCEAFGRSVAEAWAAGCELVLRGRVGAQYWIENEPERLGYDGPIAEFWQIVEDVINE